MTKKNTDNSIWDLKLSVDIKFCALMLSFNQKQNEMLNLFLLCQVFILCLLTVARSYSRNKMATYGNLLKGPTLCMKSEEEKFFEIFYLAANFLVENVIC